MTQQSKFQNSLACIIAGVIGIIVSIRIGKRFIPQVPFTVLVGLIIAAFTATIIYIVIRKRKGGMTTNASFAFWHAVIRYFLAMDMAMFALQKIFHLQFAIPLGVLDNPFSSLSGEQLIWAFFGKFYAFTVVIASLQIISAALLLFRRTWLLGIITLLPILLNILLLDWFYNLGAVVNTYITLLTIAAVYLLLSEYSRLKEFFFSAKSNLPQISFKSKAVFRFSALIIPAILIALYPLPKAHPEIYGKYEVEGYSINGVSQDTNACRDSILTKVFIDNSDFVMEYGNYQKRWIGNYDYNKQTKQIKVTWRYPAVIKDTLYVNISVANQSARKNLTGRMGKRTIKLIIQKTN